MSTRPELAETAISTSTAAQPPATNTVGYADVLLVTGVSEMRSTPSAAQDLFTSDLFDQERQYAQRRGLPWFVLSAEHGLVAPDEWISPYTRDLPDTTSDYRHAWGHWVVERLEVLTGSLDGAVIEVHASEPYIRIIASPLESKGATLLTPVRGLAPEHRLSWYAAQTTSTDPLSALTMALLDLATAVTPADFLATSDRPSGPGLYSWWVDDAGAADLSSGVGRPMKAGLIYAGSAGATRMPSGAPSANTLWDRIARMHLGGRHRFSTVRHTLGSVLADAEDRDAIDEQALTQWMHRHLRVVAVPHDDPDTLGTLEADVLAELDPPLNLRGMSSTPVRERLTELRRRYSRS